MFMVKAIPFLLAFALLACRPEPAQEGALEPENAANGLAAPLPEADINASLEPIAGNGNRQDAEPARGD